MKSLKLRPKDVPLTNLKPHPKNPNRGDVGTIKGSIEQLGFFDRILVQKSTNYVLSGNHRVYAAREAGLKTIPADIVDVDDETALRMLNIANRARDFAEYDHDALQDLLQELAGTEMGLEGTGFDASDLDAILESDDISEIEAIIPEPVKPKAPRIQPAAYAYTPEKAEEVVTSFVGRSLDGGADGDDHSEVTDDQPETVDIIPPELMNEAVPKWMRAEVTSLGEVLFASDNDWDIPALLPHLQVEHIPTPVITYGVYHKPRQVGLWLFYTDDRRFRGLWNNPHTMFRVKAPCAGELNWSMTEQTPAAHAMFMLYKKRWFSRFLQSLEMRIMVDLHVSQRFETMNLMGVPKGWKAYSTRWYSDMAGDIVLRNRETGRSHAGTKDIVFLCYGGGKQAEEFCKEHNIVWIPEGVAVIRGQVDPYGQDFSWRDGEAKT